MGVLATNNRQLIFIYSEESRIGKKALAYIQDFDKALRVININKEAISQTIWVEIAAMLQVEFGMLFSKTHPFLPLKQDEKYYSVGDWLKLINKNPSLLKYPIAIHGSHAKQIKKPQDVFKFYGIQKMKVDASISTQQNGSLFDSTSIITVNQDSLQK